MTVAGGVEELQGGWDVAGAKLVGGYLIRRRENVDRRTLFSQERVDETRFADFDLADQGKRYLFDLLDAINDRLSVRRRLDRVGRTQEFPVALGANAQPAAV